MSARHVLEPVRGSSHDRARTQPIPSNLPASFPSLLGESTPQQNPTKRLARDQAFDSYVTNRLATEMLINRTNRQSASSHGQDDIESTRSTAIDHGADEEPSAVDAAFESAFAGVVRGD